MGHLFLKRVLSSFSAAVCAAALLSVPVFSAGARQSEVTTAGGYDYEYMLDCDEDSADFTPDGNGGFDAEWSTISLCYFSKGFIKEQPASDNYSVSYDVTLDIDAESFGENALAYVCAYGVFAGSDDQFTEIFITDSTFNSVNSPIHNDGVEELGSFTSNGEVYDLCYRKVIQRSIAGYQTEFNYYYSVRRADDIGASSPHLTGSINVKEHLDAFREHGKDPGSLARLSFNVEAYKCSGSAKLNSCEITENKLNEQPEVKVIGDLNGDSRIDSFDVILFRSELIKAKDATYTNHLADIDSNGKIQVNDLVLITSFVLGKRPK